MVWPDGDGIITRDQSKPAPNIGEVDFLAAACLGTAFADPCDDDSSTFEGIVLDLQFNCSSAGSGFILFLDNRQFKFITDKSFEPGPGPFPLPGPVIENILDINCVAPVGGISVDLDGDLGDLPLQTADSSGVRAGLLAGVIVGIAAVAISVTGAAWYARRRWLA